MSIVPPWHSPPGGLRGQHRQAAQSRGRPRGTVLAGLSARSPKAVPRRDRRPAMTFMPNSLLLAARPARWWTTFARHTVSVLAVLTDALMIVGISLLVGASYHLGVYGSSGPLVSFLGVGVTTAGLFVLP